MLAHLKSAGRDFQIIWERVLIKQENAITFWDVLCDCHWCETESLLKCKSSDRSTLPFETFDPNCAQIWKSFGNYGNFASDFFLKLISNVELFKNAKFEEEKTSKNYEVGRPTPAHFQSTLLLIRLSGFTKPLIFARISFKNRPEFEEFKIESLNTPTKPEEIFVKIHLHFAYSNKYLKSHFEILSWLD